MSKGESMRKKEYRFPVTIHHGDKSRQLWIRSETWNKAAKIALKDNQGCTSITFEGEPKEIT